MINVGLAIYLIRVAQYLYGRSSRKNAMYCGKKFNNIDDRNCIEEISNVMQSQPSQHIIKLDRRQIIARDI